MEESALALWDALLEREHELERIRAAVRAPGQRAGGALIIESAAGMGVRVTVRDPAKSTPAATTTRRRSRPGRGRAGAAGQLNLPLGGGDGEYQGSFAYRQGKPMR